MKDLGGIFIGLGVLINALLAVVTYFQTRNVAKIIDKTANTIDLLEKNTNSIKDALVKVTGEAEHAKGVLQGKSETESKGT